MPKRSNPFQQLITFLEMQLAPGGATVTPCALVEPIDGGARREVDILIEQHIGPHVIRIGVECRDHGRKQDVQWIEALVGKYEHLAVHKVVAVSRAGFTAAALRAAHHFKIDTVTLESAFSANWPAECAKWCARLVVWVHRLTGGGIDFLDRNRSDLSSDELSRSRIADQNGNIVSTFQQHLINLYRVHGVLPISECSRGKWCRRQRCRFQPLLVCSAVC